MLRVSPLWTPPSRWRCPRSAALRPSLLGAGCARLPRWGRRAFPRPHPPAIIELTNHFNLGVRENRERHVALRALVENSISVLDMREVDTNLEDVYFSLTQESEEIQ